MQKIVCPYLFAHIRVAHNFGARIPFDKNTTFGLHQTSVNFFTAPTFFSDLRFSGILSHISTIIIMIIPHISSLSSPPPQKKKVAAGFHLTAPAVLAPDSSATACEEPRDGSGKGWRGKVVVAERGGCMFIGED